MGLRPHPISLMPYEPDFEREDALTAQAEEVAYAREAPAYRSCRPQPCASCAALWPVVDELQAMGRAAILETQMGGGVHAIRVWLDEGHLLANEECFSFYGDEDDEEGNDHTFYDSNDRPNPHQQAVLINIAIANHELRHSNMNAIQRAPEREYRHPSGVLIKFSDESDDDSVVHRVDLDGSATLLLATINSVIEEVTS